MAEGLADDNVVGSPDVIGPDPSMLQEFARLLKADGFLAEVSF